MTKMLKIGDFSKLSMLTIKTLRYYEKEKLLLPSKIDKWTGYRMYSTEQLQVASTIRSLRQLDFSIEDIKKYLNGENFQQMLIDKQKMFMRNSQDINTKISIINYLLEDKNMEYIATIKEIPETIVYSETRVLKGYAEVTSLALGSAEECLRLNPKIECVSPDYCFCEYLDGEYRESDITARYSQAVKSVGVENDRIKFRKLPATQVVSIYHKGSYAKFPDAYSYLVNYCKSNGYTISAPIRECYIDGAWNKDNEDEYLTEFQAPVTKD